ncbi:hypothetical protein GW17_00020952, partial [Ensete ventricosum]
VNCLVLAAEYSPFLGMEKGTVLQEARVFNDPQLDARRCAQVTESNLDLVITKLLYLLNQGETFTKVRLRSVLFVLPSICTFVIFYLRQNDRLAVSKLVTSLTKGSVQSPLAQCLLIRYTSQVLFGL